MNDTLDILSIHASISRKYHQQQESTAADILDETENEKKEHYVRVLELVNKDSLTPLVLEDLRQHASSSTETTEKYKKYQHYLIQAVPILERFKTLRTSRSKIEFFCRSSNHSTEEREDKDTMISLEIRQCFEKYMRILEKFFPHEWKKYMFLEDDKMILDQESSGSGSGSSSTTNNNHLNKNNNSTSPPQRKSSAKNNHPTYFYPRSRGTCTHCLVESEFFIHDNNYVCEKCGFVCEIRPQMMSYKDIERINMSSKYTYDRRVHFKDCINQFQGKQNATIDPLIYEEINGQLVSHKLLPENYSDLPKSIVYRDITKEHISLFLKEIGASKHYEDTTLIYHELTGKPIPDISHLENVLLRDFDMLTDLYDRKYKQNDRKNFINTQYVLFQLLRRHRYPCRKEDFNILKTIDRKYYHDEICQALFTELGWNFSNTF